ncbi:general secretion pathway protein GspJ [Burkholderia ubonensis]|uniref:General secretion pathway protein GspJ n=1 Tax=Burkholderia ubonensis TaxID=101571 RepID=A0A102HIK0_9BURK|nr:prepilin-type N-terminal cleavage/methylation domain-containing protein [Burkholderia ubonensis]AOI68972.1 general secretion pathway protein GspJ [Burkholderia ubonensis]KUZ19696.1 general secretion pathway protein GspJ [Burkholderia ubonensis]KUZ30492.1 general secretion pathway protein GspJ [Burkholderia ubonensis]KUZ38609.1 general secretion pathway protein GspJ [Burkholderia ubonensis]KUZ42782.1 general secretion pathway protein GspJ [Burkholderia ubonensis]
MKPAARSESARRARTRGFTLIELMIAIAILAVVAVLAWRGLDQIMRGRDKVSSAMEDERIFAQMFDQMRIDARRAATDDEAGQPALGVAGNTLQIVRTFDAPGAAPRLQVIRYRIAGGRVVRYASPPLADANRLRDTLKNPDVEGWSSVALMGGVGAIDAKLYVPRVGWTTNVQTADDALAQNNDAIKVPQLGNAPPPRAVTGLQVSIGATSLRVPVTRIFLVGE